MVINQIQACLRLRDGCTGIKVNNEQCSKLRPKEKPPKGTPCKSLGHGNRISEN